MEKLLETGKKYKFFILERTIGWGILEEIITTKNGIFLRVMGASTFVGNLRNQTEYLIPLRNITRIRRG